MAGILVVFFGFPAFATDPLDISTGLKTLLMMDNSYRKSVSVAVVYDPASPASKADAEAIKGYIDSGAGVPSGMKLAASLVSSADIPVLTKADVAFLAKEINARSSDTVCNAASKAGVLTISTNLDCVQANKCVLGIVSHPRVEIYYSQIAAETAHINFLPDFIMLVKRI